MRILLSLLFVMSGQAWGETLLLDPARTLNLVGEVNGSTIAEIAVPLFKLSQRSGERINLVINSPGGSVPAGTSVIDSIRIAQARGVKVRCIVGVLAASMAYLIWDACDERFALGQSKLLFHPMSYATFGEKVYLLKTQVDQMHEEEQGIMADLQENMGMELFSFLTHYRAETLWDARDLNKRVRAGYMKFVTDVQGSPFNLFQTYRDDEDLENILNSNAIPSVVKQLVKELPNAPAK